MKCVIVIVAACAFAGALGAPASQENARVSAVSEDQTFLQNDEDLKQLLEDETTVAFDGPTADGELSLHDRVQRQITAIRKAIVTTTAELANVIWQQARSHGGKLSESLTETQQKLLKQLSELKSTLLDKLRELMIPSDDVPVNYVVDEVFEQIIAGFKAQLSKALGVVSDWHNLLSESGREQMAAAGRTITDVTKKIADIVREWRKQKESEQQPEVASPSKFSNYVSSPFHNDRFMLMLTDLLEELKEQSEANKEELATFARGTEREALAYVEEVHRQLETSFEIARKTIEEVFGYQFEANASLLDTSTTLKKLLAKNVRELQNKIKNASTSEEAESLEEEIIELRRRITLTLQNLFPRP